MQPVPRLDQLRADTQSLRCAANAPAQQIAHAKLAADRAHVGRPILVDKGGISRDDEQPFDARQSGDQVFRHAIGEMLLIRLVAQILEGQHGDRRTIGQRGKLPGIGLAGADRRFCEKALEQIASLRNCPDLELAAAIEDVADILDALHQRILGHRDVAPDVVDQLGLADQAGRDCGRDRPAHRRIWAAIAAAGRRGAGMRRNNRFPAGWNWNSGCQPLPRCRQPLTAGGS